MFDTTSLAGLQLLVVAQRQAGILSMVLAIEGRREDLETALSSAQPWQCFLNQLAPHRGRTIVPETAMKCVRNTS